ncbi:glycosyltransferase family 4 protein [Cryomorpha ignava]|uniref:Glycosyltransferase family 4 protein n=1 Tax=Cryomorpha ignava TaxID=101383 RepID=A0A7K3WM10_9FLAO|nr:glycosyltransferase [Cryomorpha ignava]NEN22558.1 glycosyltransferase family 4 protein [Cryomorpha ignava]
MTRICHVTSIHKGYDTRIFLKECRSLAKAGYDVKLVAPHPKAEWVDGVDIVAVNRKGKGRLSRVLFFVWRVFYVALKTKSDIYHFHDPELVPAGIILRLMGKKVIFDIHENIARQIKSKSYLPFRLKISKLYGVVDWISAKCFFIILAEYSYEKIYSKWTKNYEIVLNMPDFDFLMPFQNTERIYNQTIELYYVGGITFVRGIETVVIAINELKSRGFNVIFHCVGPYEESVMEKIKAIPEFEQVKNDIHFYGAKRLDLALEMSKKCHIGLSILLPIENYLESYSTKIFEYMAIGLPVITSNFELYRKVIEKHECGFCVDPNDPVLLADKIEYFATHNNAISEMGKNGIAAAKAHYNWKHEEEKLLNLYSKVLFQ